MWECQQPIVALDGAEAAGFEALVRWHHPRRGLVPPGEFLGVADETGLLVDGFDTPPNMMMGHAAPYYGARVEQQGFVKVKDVIAYRYQDQGALPRQVQVAYDKALSSPGVVIRPLDKKNLMRELEVVVAIANDAWSANGGFVPWGREEMTVVGKN